MSTAEILLATVVGFTAGLIFFGGLWWTVRRLTSARHPALLALASLLVRTAIVVAAFVLVCGSSWQRFVVCLLGFVAARTVYVRRFRPRSTKEECDAAHA